MANGLSEQYLHARRRWYLWTDDGDIVEVDEGGYQGQAPNYAAPLIIGL